MFHWSSTTIFPFGTIMESNWNRWWTTMNSSSQRTKKVPMNPQNLYLQKKEILYANQTPNFFLISFHQKAEKLQNSITRSPCQSNPMLRYRRLESRDSTNFAKFKSLPMVGKREKLNFIKADRKLGFWGDSKKEFRWSNFKRFKI